MTEEVKEEVPQINLNDLKNLLAIVDAAIERSAFKPKEISSVGATRDKLEKFLEHVAASAAAAETTEPTETPVE